MRGGAQPGTLAELVRHRAVFAVQEYRLTQTIVLGQPLKIDRTAAKAWAMNQEMKRRAALGHLGTANLVSIGNGVEERDALVKVGRRWGADVKTMKFLEVSSGRGLCSQLELASLWLPALCSARSAVTVDFADEPAKLFANIEQFRSLSPAAPASKGG